MSLFQKSVLNNYLAQQDKEAVSKAYKKFTKYFHNPVVQNDIRQKKEEQYQEGFLRDLFVDVFGYVISREKSEKEINLVTEFKNQTGANKADGAILKDGNAIGVIELKGTKTKDLEKVRKQAFDYKANQPKCVYVITSNFEKLRFYIENAVEFEEFDLFHITVEQFNLLYLCIDSQNILNNLPLQIKKASIVKEESITKEFYKDYSQFKRELYRDLVKNNVKSAIFRSELQKEDEARAIKNIKLTLFKKSQKLIDRFLFIFFAENRGLLIANSTVKILQDWKDLMEKYDEPVALYNRFKKYFNYLDTGRKGGNGKAEIFAYNGGLFKPDGVLDSLVIDDELLFKHTKQLSNYDFVSEVGVNILGHIFENSLNEIESVNAEIEGGDFDKQTTKRKKDGVFYTPKYITKYIVDNTVGKLCEEKKKEFGLVEDEYLKNRKGRSINKLRELQGVLDSYRNWLLQISICDPACGSGAFLNQALDFLIKEHEYLDELNARLSGTPMIFQDIENTILENNIYGVDINEESVEIAKLSLWLRTAQPRRKLNDLNNNIKCGNSLIDSKAVAGDKAFNWKKEFTHVFDIGGFDVVIGNPPYVQHRKLFHLSQEFKKSFKVYTGTSDLSVYFFEKGIEIIKPNGYLGFINTNKFFNTEYGKPLREFLSKYKIDELINFEQSAIFKEALVSSAILLLQKQQPTDKVKYIEFNKELINPQIFEIEKVKRLQLFAMDYLKTNSWLFKNKEVSTLIDKIERAGVPFGELSGIKINRGLTTGFDDAFIIDSQKFSELIEIDESNEQILKPLLKGKHIQRYDINESNLWLINSHNGLKERLKPINLQESYPSIFAHINQINTDTNGKVESRSDKGRHWSNLRNCAFLDEFEKPKVVWGLISGNWSFALDIGKNYLTSASYFLTSEKISIEVFLALMNSRLFKFYFENVGEKTAGGAYVLKKVSIEKFIFPNNIENENRILELTSKIQLYKNGFILKQSSFINYIKSQYSKIELKKKIGNWNELEFGEFIKELNKAIKKSGGEKLTKTDEMDWMDVFETKKAEVQILKDEIDKTDKEIDQMVYELYGLSEEEIRIVEGNG